MLVSSEDWFGFEGVIESEEEFPHDCCESEFVRFAVGTQTLLKGRQDRIEASGRKRSHVKSVSQGKTRDEAMVNIRDAIQGYLESLKKHGEPIPAPITEAVVEVSA